jgi:hypothetical protein
VVSLAGYIQRRSRWALLIAGLAPVFLLAWSSSADALGHADPLPNHHWVYMGSGENAFGQFQIYYDDTQITVSASNQRHSVPLEYVYPQEHFGVVYSRERAGANVRYWSEITQVSLDCAQKLDSVSDYRYLDRNGHLITESSPPHSSTNWESIGPNSAPPTPVRILFKRLCT